MIEENRQVGPYHLIRRLAVGGMSEIYLAKSAALAGAEKTLALKVIHPKYAQDPAFVQMLIQEAKLVVQLQQVNIAQVFDLGVHDSRYYIAMEYVDGRDLYQLRRRLREAKVMLPFPVVAYIVSEIAAGLAYAHDRRDRSGLSLGVIHRDVSPQNILVSRDGEVKIIDFGIAKARERSTSTGEGIIKGKFFYMSPEHAKGEQLDHRADLYSLGLVFYELLTNRMAYDTDTARDAFRLARTAAFVPPVTHRPDIPEALQSIIDKMVTINRDARYSSGNLIRADLSAWLRRHAPGFGRHRLAEFLNELYGEQTARSQPLYVHPAHVQAVPSQPVAAQQVPAPAPVPMITSTPAPSLQPPGYPGYLTPPPVVGSAVGASQDDEYLMADETIDINKTPTTVFNRSGMIAAAQVVGVQAEPSGAGWRQLELSTEQIEKTVKQSYPAPAGFDPDLTVRTGPHSAQDQSKPLSPDLLELARARMSGMSAPPQTKSKTKPMDQAVLQAMTSKEKDHLALTRRSGPLAGSLVESERERGQAAGLVSRENTPPSGDQLEWYHTPSDNLSDARRNQELLPADYDLMYSTTIKNPPEQSTIDESPSKAEKPTKSGRMRFLVLLLLIPLTVALVVLLVTLLTGD